MAPSNSCFHQGLLHNCNTNERISERRSGASPNCNILRLDRILHLHIEAPTVHPTPVSLSLKFSPRIPFKLRAFACGSANVAWFGCFCIVSGAETRPSPASRDPSPVSTVATESGGVTSASPAAPERPMYIREYRVLGAHRLPDIEVQDAVYPFLGPGRTERDVEQARAALEKAYYEKGFQTVSVEVPPQQASRGIVVLQVVEAKVGRLRVHGSRYFSLAAIKKRAPSISAGNVPNFNEITRDIVALNQFTDRRVTPTLRPGKNLQSRFERPCRRYSVSHHKYLTSRGTDCRCPIRHGGRGLLQSGLSSIPEQPG